MYIYTHARTHTHTYTHTYIHTYIHTHIHTPDRRRSHEHLGQLERESSGSVCANEDASGNLTTSGEFGKSASYGSESMDTISNGADYLLMMP
jgi:hypothetical protein